MFPVTDRHSNDTHLDTIESMSNHVTIIDITRDL
jgi:hypothetical protein